MLVAFGVIIIGIIGIVATSIAAPLAALVGGITKRKGMRRGGFEATLVTWAVATAACVVLLFAGISGHAGSGVSVFGIPLDDLLVIVPWAWLLAAAIAIGFYAAGRRRPRAHRHSGETGNP